MNFIEIDIHLSEDGPWREICMAYLDDTAVDSLEDSPGGIKAYVRKDVFDKDDIMNALDQLPPDVLLNVQFQEIESVNWNAEWEKNFHPVSIGSTFYLRAPFHPTSDRFRFEILMQPKMAFGTGHHATTSGILTLSEELDLSGKRVLDMGCGTAVLAIAAHLLGANEIDAIDIDEWAFNNAIENLELNNAGHIKVIMGDAGDIPDKTYDLIYANINRNILLNDMDTYVDHLALDGKLYMSGFYDEDLEMIVNKAHENGLILEDKRINDRWVAAKFGREKS
jgi:ribosomal protein L11 methyltransferase